MAYNGSGLFNIDSTGQPVSANTLIESADFNALTADLATGLSNCVTKDGQQTITANLPMSGFRHTGVGNAVARTDYAAAGQVQDGKLNWVDGGGTADAITATYSPAITALVDGQLCFVRATAANATTTPTFAPNGLTARTIVKTGGDALAASDIAGDGHELILRYDLTNTRWELLNPNSQLPQSLGTADSPQFAGVNIGHASDTTLTRVSAGVVAVEGTNLVKAGAATASGLTQSADRLLGRTTAGSGAIEEITVGSGLSLSAGSLTGTALTSETPIATTSGTSKDVTLTASGVKKITIAFAAVSTNGTSNILLQLGPSGGIVTTGYASGAATDSGTRVTSTSGILVTSANASALSWAGSVELTLLNASTNLWLAAVTMDDVSSGASVTGAGYIALSGAITQLRVTMVNGTDAFDAGSFNVLTQG